MARSVATLSTSVRANTSGFRKGMRRATKTLKKFRGAMNKTGKSALKFGGEITGVATGAMALMVKQSFKAIDATAKWSKKLGIATENLIGLEHAAKRSGVNVQTFQMGLQRMTRRLAEAAVGTGEAKAALKELGINAKDLAGRGPGAALLAIADAMSRVKNQSDRVRLSFKLFDSEGVALVNMLRLGSKGLKDMMERAKELGITFNRIDAAKIEGANDAITDMKASFVGLANVAAIELAPAIQGIAESTTKWITSFDGGKAVTEGFAKMKTAAVDFADVLSGIAATWHTLRAGVLGAAEFATKGANFVLNAGSGIDIAQGKGTGRAVRKRGMSLLSQAFHKDRLAAQAAARGAATSFSEGTAGKAMRRFLESVGESSMPRESIFDSFIGGVDEMLRKARVLGDKVGEAMRKSLKAQLGEAGLNFLGLGKGGILTALAGAQAGAGSTGGSSSFGEVDLTRVSIGGRTRGAQLVKDPETKRSAEFLQKILNNQREFSPGLL